MKTILSTLIVLAILLSITNCTETQENTIKLANGCIVKGEIYDSKAHPGSKNIRTSDRELERKSWTSGVISHIGFIKKEDRTSINNIDVTSEGGSGGAIISDGGPAKNNISILNNGGIFIKIKAENNKKYLMQIKSVNNNMSPAIIFEYLKKNDLIVFQTVRAYEGDGHKKTYRILNEVDYLYLHEIKKQ